MSGSTSHPQPSQDALPFSPDAQTPPRPVLVSACLLGLATRYDGRSKTNSRVLDFLRARNLLPIPVCPEQLGGLATPRPDSLRGTAKPCGWDKACCSIKKENQ